MSDSVCLYLRTKAYYTAERNETTLREAAPGRQFWCVRSMSPMGPDDRMVGPNDCVARRACFHSLDVTLA
jgi:hypothetical protein